MAGVARDREKQYRHVNEPFRLKFMMIGPAAFADKKCMHKLWFCFKGPEWIEIRTDSALKI